MNTRFDLKMIGWAALILALVLVPACSGPSTPAPATQPVDSQPNEAPAATEAGTEGTPAAGGPSTGGPGTGGADDVITIVIPEDPSAFNGIVSDTGYNQMVMELALLGVADIDPEGNVFPELAVELPTVENGGVVINEDEDAMDVTWKLRQDITWADGEPVTADDVLFTWNAITDPDGGIWAEGVDYTESIEKIDDFTFIVHYNSIYPAYLTHFGGENFAVFAEHYCDASQGFVSWDCNLNPLSSGPYVLDEWVTGDHLTFVANPNYYEEGKPAIETVVVRIVPEKSVEKTMLLQGDADLIMWATEEMIVDLQDQPGVGVSFSPTDRWVMRLFINQAARGTTDREATPHPALSDARVRQAIRKAIDVNTIIEEIWHGYPKPVSTEFFRPPYVCDVPIPEFNPDEARSLLEAAGWTDADGDGIRECHGCENGEEGAPLSMELAIYSEYGNELELTQQLMAEMLKTVGMDAQLSMVEGAVMWADSSSGGTEQTGNYEINMWDDGYPGVDPSDYLWYLYHSDSTEVDNGWNVMRWKNPEFDALLESTYTLDEEVRREAFCQMAEILAEELPIIPLFSTVNSDAHSARLQGVQSSINDMVTWNAADWTLAE